MHNNVEIYSKFNGTAVLTAAGVLSFYNNLESNGEQARPDSRERLSPLGPEQMIFCLARSHFF
jgi:hypothetical protein